MITSRQRLLATIAGEPVDRIPVAPFIHSNYVHAVWSSAEVDLVEKTAELYCDFGFDMIHRNCTPAYDDLLLEGENWTCQVELEQLGGNDTNRHYIIRTPEGELRQTIGTRWISKWECEVAPVDYLIKSEADLALLEKYQPPVGEIDGELIRRAARVVGEDGVVAPWINGVFNTVAYSYRPLGEVSLDPLLQPEFYDRMMRHFLGRCVAIARQFIAAGADFLSIGVNMASGKLFDGSFIEAYVLPYEMEFFAALREAGGATIAHNCGHASRLLPLYARLGTTIYESLTPPPHGDTRIEEAVRVLGPEVTLMGGLDQIDLLRHGSPAQVEQAVSQIMQAVHSRCRYILGTSDYLLDETPPENLRALARAGHEMGVF
ncbi:MAG TPA: uroporphyrinogen decarboxylase family protein [Candidatus Sumerlaeota bacterium]|nr:uroporphyrinogen decarboxylase family protein [Candidatus Sumerlaeota bacterium]HOR26576.1 uroporphyrinogen decarboxylase family protein [Candidatus Sumerlaeota bacterium]HPK01235.1 uroporphyrinogen decarboxylase family protein [Candidatus Sumerlaeota bacterium]